MYIAIKSARALKHPLVHPLSTRKKHHAERVFGAYNPSQLLHQARRVAAICQWDGGAQCGCKYHRTSQWSSETLPGPWAISISSTVAQTPCTG